ncbi:MAG: acetate--CoA ligase family protein [Acidobacteriota bacterium]
MDAIFRPRSIAVIGVSRDRTSIGREILHNLIEYEFNGAIYPVNPNATAVHSLKCYPDVASIPDPIDLAVVVVPCGIVAGVVDACGRKGVRGVVVITAGYKEVGGEGIRREAELVEMIRRHGMRMVGPNCMGVVNSGPQVRMNATFAKAMPPSGPMPARVGFISQSGALGETILANARETNLGISMFASTGNKADISVNDLLEYWEDDPSISIILMYIESFGNPAKFTQIARRVARKKPILAVKAGRTASGARAASTHTGSLAGLDVAVDSLLAQCGVIRASSIEEMFVFAQTLSKQPVPAGPRIGIVTNAGGPGILAADACESLGLRLPELSERSLKDLRKVLPSEATPANPLDLIATAGPERYEPALRIVLADPAVDALIVIFVSPIMIDAHAVARTIVAAASEQGQAKPIVTCFMGKVGWEEGILELESHEIPVYRFPELAAQGLAAAVRYGTIQSRPEGRSIRFQVDHGKAAAIVGQAVRRGGGALDLLEARDLIATYGIPFVPCRRVSSSAEAIAFGLEVGYPVVLKAGSAQIDHKTELGAVRLDLRNGDETGQAYAALRERLDSLGSDVPIIAQKMITGGKEIILGAFRDPQFGPVGMFGIGGIYVEVLKDVAFRVLPITDREAAEMVRSIRGFPLLMGVRGEAGVDIGTLEQMLLRMGQLMVEQDAIDSLDINPFIISKTERGSMAVDIRVMLGSP